MLGFSAILLHSLSLPLSLSLARCFLLHFPASHSFVAINAAFNGYTRHIFIFNYKPYCKMRVIIKQSLKITATPLIASRRQFKTLLNYRMGFASLNVHCNWLCACVMSLTMTQLNFSWNSAGINWEATLSAFKIDAPKSNARIWSMLLRKSVHSFRKVIQGIWSNCLHST